MAKASDTITLTAVRDIESVTWYYQLKAGTSAPAKPTASPPPSPWQTTEPSYTAGDTKYLFIVERTVYTDGSFEYTTPTMSSAYEAAKLAYNEAQNAKKTATDYMQTVNGGVWVTPVDKKPDNNGNATSTTRGVRITDQIDIFRGTESVASFGESARIGPNDGKQSYVEIDYHSLQAIDRDGKIYFYVSDLRDQDGTVTEDFTGDGTTRQFYVSVRISVKPTVTVDGEPVTAFTWGVGNTEGYVVFDTAPAEGAEITIKYTPPVWPYTPKAYSIGIRGTGDVGVFSVEEGYDNVASGTMSHAEGRGTLASGNRSHSEGADTKATAPFSHAEGYNTEANNRANHAEGWGTTANGDIGAHAEGYETTATGKNGAHAEGYKSNASGQGSHAEGYNSVAGGLYAHAQNYRTNAGSDYQTAIGKYNDNQSDNAFEIGNGTSDSDRSNALTVDWDGNLMARGMAGMIQMFAGFTAPDGWLLCHGQAVSRTEYAKLFSVISTTYGAGDGSTTFNVPDLRDRMPIGAGNTYMLNAKAGAASHHHTTGNFTLGVTHIPAHTHGKSGAITSGITSSGAHTHTFKTQADYASSGGKKGIYSTSDGTWTGTSVMTSTGAHTHNLPAHEHTSVGGGQAHNHGNTGDASNMPPYIGINFIICTGKTS